MKISLGGNKMLKKISVFMIIGMIIISRIWESGIMMHTSLARKRLLTALTLAFLLSASAATIISSDLITEGVSAAPAPGRSAAWWDGGGADNNASTKENWENDTAPSAGNDIVIHYGNKAITWDIGASFGDFLIRSTYTGTITMGASYEVMEFYQANGSTFTASASYILTVHGNYSNYGTLTANLLGLNMTGDDKSVYMTGNPSKVWIYGNTTWSTSNNIRNSLYIASNKTITLVTSLTLQTQMSGFSYTNLGSIITQGASYFKFQAGTSGSRTINFGNIGACILETNSASTTSNVITLGTETTFSGNIYIASSHASNTMTLDLGGKNIFCNRVTVGTRGLVVSSLPSSSMGLTTGASSDCMIINANGVVNATNISSITLNGNWDSSAGSWVPSSSLVSFIGTGTVKTADGQTFYNLTAGAGAGVTQSSNVEVTNWMALGGSWNKNGYDLIAPMYSPAYAPVTSVNEGDHYEFYPEFNSIVNMTVLSNNAAWLIPDYDDIGMAGDTSACDSGTYVINLEFTNVIGTYWINWTLTVNNTLFGYFISMPITDITAGQLYSYHPEVSCNGTYTLWLGGDNVLYASNITGNITGYPNAGVYSIILWMEDESGNIAYQNWTLTVSPVTSIWTNDDIMNFIAHWAILLITLMMAFLGYRWNIGFLTVFGFIFYLFAIPYMITGKSIDLVAVLGVGLAQIGIIIAWLKN